jgi:hypothetical protein
MEVVKLPGVRHQFLTQCFLEALSRSGMSYEECKLIEREYLLHLELCSFMVISYSQWNCPQAHGFIGTI